MIDTFTEEPGVVRRVRYPDGRGAARTPDPTELRDAQAARTVLAHRGQLVQELLRLVIRDGVMMPILVSDDTATIERFVREGVPALIDAVARERQ